MNAEARYRRVALPMISVAPPGVDTIVRGSATMFGDDPAERFAAAAFLYVGGEAIWEGEKTGLDYDHPVSLRVPEVTSEPGLLFIYATREAYLDGTAAPRVPRFEESWVFLTSGGDGATAVSVPAVPYIGSRKQGIDHKYQCFAGLRMAPEGWRSVAYVMNPYPDPLELRGWLQSPRGQLIEVVTDTVPACSVRAIDLVEAAARVQRPDTFDYGTLVVWGSLKPQGYVAIQGPDGRTRAMDHFNPFWA